ncbi:hypothetical protein DL765_001925 [Monosporascus sp. GIB2]|nr:hypothetical protein DL765_001925 [Monosporascus sp. GIB2]
MEHDGSAISALRAAKIAKHTIWRQVEQACAALEKSIDSDPRPPPRCPLAGPAIPPNRLGGNGFGKVLNGIRPGPILQDLGLEHGVIEASNRPGGRVQTHRFTLEDGDYYEVGAMLFADTPIMTRTFKLLKLLNIEKDTSPDPKQATLIPFYFSGPNNPVLFNNILVSGSPRPEEVDPFQVSTSNGGTVGNRAYLIEKYPAKTGEDPGTGYFDVSFLTWLLLSVEFKNPSTLPPTHDAEPVTKKAGPVWRIVNGGSDIVAERLAGKLQKEPLYNYRVTKISRKKGGEMAVTMQRAFVAEPVERVYSHVITTATAPCLRHIDLRDAGLRYAHREAIRVLHYDSGLKAGIKFKRRWLAEDRGITKGGIGKTDRPTRIDASRLGALSMSSNPGAQVAIFDTVMADLTAMHGYPEADLRRMVLEYHVRDWDRDPLALGHVASLAPDQFATFFGDMHIPVAEGRLVFAGEIVSIYHGWIVAALNSAYVAVYKLLLSELFRNIRTREKTVYLLQKLARLKHNWGMADEVESEYDEDPKESLVGKRI